MEHLTQFPGGWGGGVVKLSRIGYIRGIEWSRPILTRTIWPLLELLVKIRRELAC